MKKEMPMKIQLKKGVVSANGNWGTPSENDEIHRNRLLTRLITKFRTPLWLRGEGPAWLQNTKGGNKLAVSRIKPSGAVTEIEIAGSAHTELWGGCPRVVNYVYACSISLTGWYNEHHYSSRDITSDEDTYADLSTTRRRTWAS